MSFNSRAVYQRYTGWYDANPAHLAPAPPAETGKRYVTAMGGADKVKAMAADATLTVARPVFLDSLFRGMPLLPKILAGEVKLEGDRAAMGGCRGGLTPSRTIFRS